MGVPFLLRTGRCDSDRDHCEPGRGSSGVGTIDSSKGLSPSRCHVALLAWMDSRGRGSNGVCPPLPPWSQSSLDPRPVECVRPGPVPGNRPGKPRECDRHFSGGVGLSSIELGSSIRSPAHNGLIGSRCPRIGFHGITPKARRAGGWVSRTLRLHGGEIHARSQPIRWFRHHHCEHAWPAALPLRRDFRGSRPLRRAPQAVAGQADGSGPEPVHASLLPSVVSGEGDANEQPARRTLCELWYRVDSVTAWNSWAVSRWPLEPSARSGAEYDVRGHLRVRPWHHTSTCAKRHIRDCPPL